MKIHLLMTFLLLAFFHSVFAQVNKITIEEHHDDHHKNEIGIAYSPAYMISDKEWANSIHLHYLRKITDSRFSLGVGYERIFSEHNHDMVNLIGSVMLFPYFSFNLAPGLVFEHANSDAVKLAMHLEFTYEFEIENFHIGPMVGFSISTDDYHIGAGVHLGYGF